MLRKVRTPLAVSTLMVAALCASIGTAQAQSFWGGADTGKNSVYDRQIVSFDTNYRPGEIIVSFGDRRLYHVTSRGRAVSYPIAVPRPESRWDGVLRVSMKRENPDWTPTARMRRENPDLPSMVEGGSKLNPLGVRALYLGSTLYRIHGTDAPWTIGKNVSKGCIRMHNEHVVELYNNVSVGARVSATWKQFRPTVRSADMWALGGPTQSAPGWGRQVFGLN